MARRPNRRLFGIGELGRRLIAAFIGVVVAALAAEILFAAASVGQDVSQFTSRAMHIVTTGAAASAEAAYGYADADRWQPSRLTPVLMLVHAADAAVQVRSRSGTLLASSPAYAGYPAAQQQSAPIVAGGRTVGTVTVRFGHQGLAAQAAEFNAQRWRIRLYSFVLAVLLALIVSTVLSRQITAPLERVLIAMRARGAGDRGARIERVRGVGVIRELSEGFNTSMDALDQRDRTQRNLVADAAHQLRTPVAILQAGHEAMLDGILEPTPANLGSLRDEVLRLGGLLEDLQALAAAESAALQLDLQPHDLADIARGLTTKLAATFEIAGLSLVSDLTEVTALCDAKAIDQVLENLLTNACKYTPSGGRVTVSTGPADRHLAQIVVADSGSGIPADDLPHVTERFFRGKRAAEMAAGSGFGLTIVSELVAAQYGYLDIASEVGVGTTVTVTLPADRYSP